MSDLEGVSMTLFYIAFRCVELHSPSSFSELYGSVVFLRCKAEHRLILLLMGTLPFTNEDRAKALESLAQHLSFYLQRNTANEKACEQAGPNGRRRQRSRVTNPLGRLPRLGFRPEADTPKTSSVTSDLRP